MNTQTASPFDLSTLSDPLFGFSPSDQELLRRCATVRVCDHWVFDQVLRAGLNDAMSLEALAALHFVDKLPGEGYRYQLRSSTRTEIFNTWWRGDGQTAGHEAGALPTSLQQLSLRLASHYQAQGDDLEQLYHRAVVDEVGAIRLLGDLFDAADAEFDLPQCSAVLRTLEERSNALLGPNLQRALAVKRVRLQTRSLWAQDYRATIPYIERNETKDLLDQLLADQKRWILNIHAPGGMGKTMYLRVVVARRCVPDNIPCAKIDFDFVPYLANVASQPWRLLLRIAQQLTRQLLDNPFQELLTSYGRFAAEAESRAIVSPQAFVGADLSDQEKQVLRASVLSRFTRALQDLNTPVVFILDTLENLLHGNMDLEAVYDLLLEVHARCPHLRVILAGRMDLEQPLPQVSGQPAASQETGFVQRFAGQNIAVRLQGFDDAEASAYLAQKRGLVDDPRAPVMIEKARIHDANLGSEGVSPFKLALLADIVRVHPTIKKEEFERYEDVDLAHLIERVVDRIHDAPLKWLVRYGVVPRLLTRSIVEDVIVPFMVQGMRGQASEDDATQDATVEKQLAGREEPPFPVGSADSVDVSAKTLWELLYRYTAESSWVRADEERDALVFHQDVVEPMRRLLRKHLNAGRHILPHLHLACARYYHEVRAAADPDRRGQWLREAVYHKLQSGDPDADSYWLKLFDEARDDRATVTELAEEAVSEPLVFDEASSQAADDMLRFGEAVRARAHYELARGIVEDRELSTQDDWAAVDHHLAAAERLSAAAGGVPSGELGYLRSRVLLAQRQPEQALEVCWQAVQQPASPSNELELHLLYAQILSSLNRPDAVQHFARAAALADELDGDRMPAIASGWVAALDAEERFEEAVEVCVRWRAALDVTSPPDMIGDSLLARMRQHLAMGQERRAALLAQSDLDAWLTASPTPRSALEPWPTRLQAEISLAQGQPAAALQQLERNARPASKGRSAPSRQPFETDLRARIYAALVDVLRAKPEMEMLAWSIHGPRSEPGVGWLLEYSRLHIDETGNLREASDYLRSAQENAQDEVSKLRCELMRIRWLTRKGQRAEAQDAAATLATRSDLPAAPSLRLQVALEYVIHNDTPAAWQALLEAVRRVEPASRRLMLLAELRRSTRSHAIPPATRDELLALLPDPGDEKLDPALAALRLANVLCAVDLTEQARGLLRDAEAASLDPLRLVTLRQVYQALDRSGWRVDALKSVALDELLDRASGENRELCGLMLLEHAERVATVLNDPRWAAALLERAESLLKSTAGLWSPRELALRSHIASRQGDTAASRDYLDQATKAFLAVDDAQAAEALRASVSHGESWSVSVDEPAHARPAALDVHLSQVGRMWRVDMAHSDGRSWSADVPPESSLADLIGSDPNEAISHRFAEEFEDDWQRLTLAMGNQLFPPEARSLLTGDPHPPDIRLDIRSASLEWLPWELVRIDPESQPLPLSHAIGLFYRLVKQMRVTSPGDAAPGDRQPGSVVVVLMAEAADTIGTRGSQQSTGADLAFLYRRAGIPCDELAQPGPEQLQAALTALRPSVLHVVSNLVEVGPQAALVFGSRRDVVFGDRVSKSLRVSGYPQTVTASQMSALVAMLEPAPLVVLDTPAPPVTTERLRQLFLRNAFAADWATHAPPAAILGIGLGETRRQQQDRLVHRLIQLLRKQEPIGKIAQQIRREADGSILTAKPGSQGTMPSRGVPPSLLPFAATALFTDRPEQVFPLKEV
jgi:cellulose synthase operon protein C